jgi:hypothetical protein
MNDTKLKAYPEWHPMHEHMQGMSLRDYFAIHATDEDVARHLEGPLGESIQTDMQGRKMIITRPTRRNREQARFAFADAMMKARDQ